MRTTFSAGGVVINNHQEVLVVNQNGNSWSLPKGHIDDGETSRQAAEREIREEAGIAKLEYIKDLGGYERYQIGKDGGENKEELKNITMFMYTTQELDLNPEDSHNPEARWVEMSNVAELLTHPKDKQFFESVMPDLKEFIV